MSSHPQVDGSDRILTMRNGVPWNSGAIKTPDGQTGTSVVIHPEETDLTLDLNKMYLVLGVCDQHGIIPTKFDGKRKNDLRGIYNRDS